MLSPATKAGAFNAHSSGLYRQFNGLLVSIKEAGTPQIRSMWEADLILLMKEADNILQDNLQYLDHHSQAKLRIILSRPYLEWVTLARNGNAPLVS